MTVTIIDRLVEHGFTKPYLGAREFTKAVPGRFGFTLTITVEDWDGDPLSLPIYTVALPHQCDAWTVADAPDPGAVWIHLRNFIKEAESAHAMLADLMASLPPHPEETP